MKWAKCCKVWLIRWLNNAVTCVFQSHSDEEDGDNEDPNDAGELLAWGHAPA